MYIKSKYPINRDYQMSRTSTYECESKDKFTKGLIPIIFLIDII